MGYLRRKVIIGVRRICSGVKVDRCDGQEVLVRYDACVCGIEGGEDFWELGGGELDIQGSTTGSVRFS